MALDRPVKTYGTRKYTDEVAAAPSNEDPILANEVDADFETIYGAWNGGVDTGNIKVGAVGTNQLHDGAVTLPKLDPALQGAAQGTFPGPVTFAPRMQMMPGTTYADVQVNAPGTPNFDNTKPAWLIRADYNGDVFQLWRAPAPGTVFTTVLQVDGVGNLTAIGFAKAKGYGGGIYLPAPTGPMGSGATIALPLTTLWLDSGGCASAVAAELHAPAFNCWVTLSARVSISGNAGLGMALNIESSPPATAWTIAASMITNIETNFTLTRSFPASANQRYRVTMFNGTGVNPTVNSAEFVLVTHGAY